MYGDQQANYTDLRSAFGGYGGAVASGAMGGGGYGSANENQGIAGTGANAMPVSYLPPPMYVAPQGGMYAVRQGYGSSIGYAVGWNEAPRNTSQYEIQTRSSQNAAQMTVAGAASGALAAAGIGMGLAASGIGAVAGSFVGAGIGTLLGGPLGTLAGAKVGGFIGGMAPSILSTALTGGISDVIARQQETKNYLDSTSFRFVGAGSSMSDPRTRSGMSMKARQDIAETMMDMDIKDKFMDQGDLSRVLKSGVEQGMFTGTKDIDDFKKKFKTLAENVKEVAKAFNTTIEESVKVMRDMRGMGMDPAQARSVVTQADALGRVSGRTAAEMFSIGQQGAEIFRGTGVAMQVGFQSTQANIASIRAQRDAGILSQEAIAQAGGEEALAMRLTTGSLSFAQTGLGRGVAMSMVKNGVLDQDSVMGMLSGNRSIVDTAKLGADNIHDPANLIRFQANQAKNLSALGKQFGGQGLLFTEMATFAQRAEQMAEATGASKEDSFRSIALRSGKTESELEAMLGMMKDPQKALEGKQAALSAVKRKQQVDAMHSNFVLTRVTESIGDAFLAAGTVVAKPVSRAIDAAGEWAKGAMDRQLYGVDDYDATARAASIKDSLASEMLSGKTVGGKRTTAINLDKSGYFANSSGEALVKRMQDIKENFGTKMVLNPREGGVILDERMGGEGVGANWGVTGKDWEALKQQTATLREATTSSESIRSSDEYKKYAETRKNSLTADVMNNLKGATTSVKMLEAISGKTLDKMSKIEISQAQETLSSMGGRYSEAMDEQKKSMGALEDAVQAEQVVSVSDALAENDKIGDDISRALSQEKFTGSLKDVWLGAKDMLGMNKLDKEAEQAVRSFMGAKGEDKVGAQGIAAKEMAKSLGISFDEAYEKLTKLGKRDDLVKRAQESESNVGMKMVIKGAELAKANLRAGGLEDVADKLSVDPTSVLALKGKEEAKLKEIRPDLYDAKTAMESLTAASENAKKEGKTLTGDQMKSIAGKFIPAAQIGKAVEAAASGRLADVNKAIWSGALMKGQDQAAAGSGGATTGASATGTAQDQFTVQSNINYTSAQILEALAKKMGVR